MENFNLIAGAASIVGLLFSILAFWQAKSAATAAKNAEQAVLRRTLGEELGLTCERTEQLVDLVEHSRFPEAALLAMQVMLMLSELPSRRAPYMDDDMRNGLLSAREQIKVISEECAKARDKAPIPSARQRIIQSTRETAMNLRGKLGRIKSEMDVGAKT